MLTVRQAAERLAISPALIYALCSAGKLRHERYGLKRGTIRIPEDALEEYRKAATQAPITPPPSVASSLPALPFSELDQQRLAKAWAKPG